MANTYAANFGDVVKHTVLCAVIESEGPSRYLESHGGRLDYELATLDPGPGGVWDFLERATGVDTLSSSTYTRLISASAGRPEHVGSYLGSIALADAILPVGIEVVAFELVEASAVNLRDGLARRGRPAQVLVADGLTGVCAMAAPGDLVFLDPFDVEARGEELTSAEAFAELASRGVPTVLWYAIHDRGDRADRIVDGTSDAVGAPWQARLIGDTSEGGLLGCEFLTAHLSVDTRTTAAAVVDDLVSALAPNVGAYGSNDQPDVHGG